MSDLFLSDDPPPRPSRPRWVDALGLAAVVAGMIAIGVVGDRGSKDATNTPTTTTTTTVQPMLLPSRGSSTTRPGPTFIAKRLRDETNTALLLLADGQQPLLLEVDTGLVRPLVMPSGYAVTGTSAGFVIAAPGQLWLMPITERGVVAARATAKGAHELVPAGLDHTWFTSPSDARVLVAELRPDGTETGRTISLPGRTQVVAGLDDGIVVSQAGNQTYIPVRGTPRAIGTGAVLGGGGHTIVRSACDTLPCRVDLLDVTTGRSQPVTGIPEPQPPIGGGGVVSRDGRWFAVTLYDTLDGVATLVTIDLTSGRGRVLNRGTARPKVFAVTGRTLFTIDRGRLQAYDAGTGSNREFSDLDTVAVSRLAATIGP